MKVKIGGIEYLGVAKVDFVSDDMSTLICVWLEYSDETTELIQTRNIDFVKIETD